MKKEDKSVKVNPKSIVPTKVDIVRFHLKKDKIVAIDKNLKRIYSITN